MSLSNAFMANNNIKRGFLFKPSNPYNNFKFQSHQRCVKKVLKSCIKYEFWQTVDYKDVNIISKYVNDNGKILPRRFTGTCAKHQRHVAEQVKRARFMGFIPFCK